jgi:DNA-binding winged helix-turn-helix (wHTH) protein
MIAMQITAIAQFSFSKAERYLERLAGCRPTEGIAMRPRITSRIKTSQTESAFVGGEPATHVPALTTRCGPHSSLRSSNTQMQRNDVAEFLTDINGVPVRVRFTAPNLSADSKGANVHTLLSMMIEKALDGLSRSPVRCPDHSEARATVELIIEAEDSARIPAQSNDTLLRVGPLELDLLERTAKRANRRIDLRPREFQLLKYMMQQSDKLLTRATLLKEVWNYKFVPDTNLVDVHMGKLRRKVDGPNEPPLIRNVRGAGFVLDAIPFAPRSMPTEAERSEPLRRGDDASRPETCTLQ